VRPLSRRQQRIALLALPVVALGAAGVLWFSLSDPRAPDAARASADSSERARRAVDPVAYVALRTDVSNGRNLDDLVQAYGVWVSRPDAQAARRNIILALLDHRDRMAGLQALLIAVDRDPTPRSKDPLWPDLVRQVGKLWDAVTLAGDLIDLYPTLAPDQKPAVSKALQGLAGTDVVEILAGRGLGEGQPLRAAVEKQQVLEQIRRNPVKERPPEE
jgi:hypothetical protein